MIVNPLRGLLAASLLLFFLGSTGPAGAGPVAMLTFHNDNTRQGANTNETLLTPANVNVNHFGRLFSHAVDGYVYAQPLIMTNLAIPGKGVHNVVFVATEHDTIYAFDADSRAGGNDGLLWQTNIGAAAPLSPDLGARFHREGNTDLVPEAGITGTPVIDPGLGALFVDVFSREGTNYFHRIHALDVSTGRERKNSPLVVTASIPGTGVDSVNGVITFNAKQHLQRPALTLAGGILFVAYGSHADTDPYHGWILGFDPVNLRQLTNYVFNTTPNARTPPFPEHAGEGALWMGGAGLCADAANNLYFEVANGSFSANTNGGDYGDSFVKLSTVNGFAVMDYFTPFDQAAMQANDADLGSGGPMLLPDSAGSAAHRHLIVGAGKPGIIHLVDCDNLGKFNAANDSQIVQEIPRAIGGGGSYAAPAYFNNHIYYTGKTDNVKAFAITNGVITPTPTSKSPTSLGSFTGAPVISADGVRNGIVWVIDPGAYRNKGPAVLHAYNADNLAQELYNSSQKLARDNPGGAVKMTSPTVAGGKVYVGAEDRLSVYGVQDFLDTPTISPAAGLFTNRLTVTLSGVNLGAGIFYTLDGTVPTSNSLRYSAPFEVRENTTVRAIALKPGAVDSGIASAAFVNNSAPGTGTGLTGEYFPAKAGANPFSGPPVLTRVDAAIDFNWNTNGPDSTLGHADYAVRWTGSVQPRYSETYNFVTTADGAVRLYVNGQLLIDNWTDHPVPSVKSNTVALAAQQLYNLELDYYTKSGKASATLAWSSPSTPLATVPQTQLYPYANQPPTVSLFSPANNSAYTAAASVTISARAEAPHNPIGKVEFYAGRTLLGAVSQPPYTITATGLGAGGYTLTAIATDGSGLSSTSAPVAIKVESGGGQPYGLARREASHAFLNLPLTFNGSLPLLLSQTGVFSDTPGMTPADGLVSYSPQVPLWADGAVSTSYFAVPGHGGAASTPVEQISFSPTGAWTFPAGTVFVKTLELNTDTAHPRVTRRLETQLLVWDVNNQVYGVTYKWRADGTDADLLLTGQAENLLVTNATGISSRLWNYGSPADCRLCHTPAANYILGVNTRQLNARHTYRASGVTDNQLRTLNRLGLFNPAMDESAIALYEKLPALADSSASLEDRVRGYLDANCAQCHRPGVYGLFDARYETPLAKQNLVNVVAAFNLGHDHAHIVTPRDPSRSVLYDRMSSLDPTIKMPMVGHNLADTNALGVISTWINSLPDSPEVRLLTNPGAQTNLYE